MRDSMCHPSGVFLRRITRKRGGSGHRQDARQRRLEAAWGASSENELDRCWMRARTERLARRKHARFGRRPRRKRARPARLADGRITVGVQGRGARMEASGQTRRDRRGRGPTWIRRTRSRTFAGKTVLSRQRPVGAPSPPPAACAASPLRPARRRPLRKRDPQDQGPAALAVLAACAPRHARRCSPRACSRSRWQLPGRPRPLRASRAPVT